MSVVINRSMCVACGKCEDVCPGNIIRSDDSGKRYVSDPSDCWSCASCMKECPAQAIRMILPPEIDGHGGEMSLLQKKHITKWKIKKKDGSITEITTDTKEANKY